MTEPNGLQYMRARYYDPEVGRFISEDPIGFGGGDVNLYAYCIGNPINRIDPDGLWTLQFGIGFNAGGVFGATKSGGVIVGRNSKTGKWQFGLYATGGAGAQGGAGASATVDVTWSSNDNISNVAGLSTTAGGSATIPVLGVGVSTGYEKNTPLSGNANSSNTFSLGIGVGMPYEGHGFASSTYVKKLY